MTTQLSLGSFCYPTRAAERPTRSSIQAAEKVETKAKAIRHRILRLLRDIFSITPDAAATLLGEHYMDVRPRFSELAAQGLIERTGEQGVSARGTKQDAWRLKR